MAIEIVPKQKIKEVPWANVALYFVLALLLVFILSYLALAFYKLRFEREISEIEAALERTSSEAALEQEVLGLKKRIEDSKQLFLQHRLPHPLFELLEQNTIPRVWFFNAKFDFEKAAAQLSGRTDNFETLGQQTLILEKQEFIKSVQLSQVSPSREGGITFDLELTFDPKIFGR